LKEEEEGKLQGFFGKISSYIVIISDWPVRARKKRVKSDKKEVENGGYQDSQ
jgi:hypothetical protein